MDVSLMFAALSMGFVGSLHCVGMCGPIMLILPFSQANGWRKAAGIGLYHFGRVTVYALMGLVLYSFRSAFHPEVQRYVSVALGVVLLLFGVLSFLPAGLRIKTPWLPFIKNKTISIMGRPGLGSILMNGMLNGLLPCGLVYVALALAVTASNVTGSIFTMYSFGIGTIPMLVTVTLLKTKIPFLRRDYVRKNLPIVMLLFGAIFVVRGMNLGVPYLSPKLDVKDNRITESCCQHPRQHK